MSRTLRIALSTAGALTVLGSLEALLCLAAVAQWQVIHRPGPASLDEALTVVVVVLAAGLGGWLALSTLASLVAHLPGRLGALAERCARAWAPAASRRVAAVLVGAVVGGALAPGTALGDGSALPSAVGPGFATTSWSAASTGTALSTPGPGFATASSTPGPGFATTSSSSASSSTASSSAGPGFSSTAPPRVGLDRDPAPAPNPGWTPLRPVQRPQPASGLVTGSAQQAAAGVVVHRGDTLWGIARRHLGPDASDVEVANAWPAWHEANRAVIGDDPDLILPGQVLRAPSGAAYAASAAPASPLRSGVAP